ncbi:MAG TPA: type 4a pilus biogenesis protein PilO [Gemmatimonadales bacterium]|jgi:hypothetical protein
MRIPVMHRLALALLALALLGCSDDSNLGDVRLQLASLDAASSSASVEAGQLVINAGDDEIVLDQVGLVLRKIRLEGPSTESCPEDGQGDSGCGELEFGPVLFELPLAEDAEGVLDALVPVGSYSGLKFQLHRPTNANEDADFVAEHPDYDDISIRVVGTYNGTPFTFTSDLTDVETVPFAGPVEVESEGPLPLTLLVQVAGWFAAEGGGLVNPADANDGGPLESVVERQIRESFRAFHDGDSNGSAD